MPTIPTTSSLLWAGSGLLVTFGASSLRTSITLSSINFSMTLFRVQHFSVLWPGAVAWYLHITVGSKLLAFWLTTYGLSCSTSVNCINFCNKLVYDSPIGVKFSFWPCSLVKFAWGRGLYGAWKFCCCGRETCGAGPCHCWREGGRTYARVLRTTYWDG